MNEYIISRTTTDVELYGSQYIKIKLEEHYRTENILISKQGGNKASIINSKFSC